MLGYTEKDGFPKKNAGADPEEQKSDQERENTARSLFGVLPPDVTLEESREERLKEI